MATFSVMLPFYKKLVLFILPETNSSPLKMGAAWKFGDSYWKPPFLGAMLVLGRVPSWERSLKSFSPCSLGAGPTSGNRKDVAGKLRWNFSKMKVDVCPI